MTFIACVCCYLLGLPCCCKYSMIKSEQYIKIAKIPILNFSLCWTIRSGFDGHLRCWICHLMDCLLGVRWIHVDLWSQERLQGYQAHDWQRARMVLENHLGRCCTYFLVGDFHRLCSTMGKTSVCITVLY